MRWNVVCERDAWRSCEKSSKKKIQGECVLWSVQKTVFLFYKKYNWDDQHWIIKKNIYKICGLNEWSVMEGKIWRGCLGNRLRFEFIIE